MNEKSETFCRNFFSTFIMSARYILLTPYETQVVTHNSQFQYNVMIYFHLDVRWDIKQFLSSFCTRTEKNKNFQIIHIKILYFNKNVWPITIKTKGKKSGQPFLQYHGTALKNLFSSSLFLFYWHFWMEIWWFFARFFVKPIFKVVYSISRVFFFQG